MSVSQPWYNILSNGLVAAKPMIKNSITDCEQLVGTCGILSYFNFILKQKLNSKPLEYFHKSRLMQLFQNATNYSAQI